MYLYFADLHSTEHLITWCVGKKQVARHKYIGISIVFVLTNPTINWIGKWQNCVRATDARLGQSKILLVKIGGLHDISGQVVVNIDVQYVEIRALCTVLEIS
jgi:hypothetical protein